MKTVLFFGTFDFLHSGHIYAFEQAKKLGERLIVSVASDVAVKIIKGRVPIHSQNERLALVQHVDIVDEAFIGDEELGVYSFFLSVVPDVVALGYDQDMLKADLKQYIEKSNHTTHVVTLPIYRDGKTKSSSIKADLGI